MNDNAKHRPARSEPLLWLVIGLPLAAVIAGIATLVIAIRAGGSEALPDPVRRTAQMQQLDLTPDRRARDDGIQAHLQLEAGRELRITLTGADDDVLLVQLIHPTDASQDRQVALARADHAWIGRLPEARMDHDWRVQLAPADQRWRLHGRWPAGRMELDLAPALEHE